MKQAGSILHNSYTVNGKLNNLSTVNSNNSKEGSLEQDIETVLEKHRTNPEGLAIYISEQLDDVKSQSYYLLLTQNTSHGKLLNALSLTKEAYREGRIRKSKAVYFLAILRNWGIQTKFKKS